MPATLEIKVIPNASRNEIAGWQDGILKIKVQSPPEDGKANAAVLALLVKAMGCRKSEISLRSGEKSRKKTLQLAHWTPQELQTWLNEYSAR